MILSRGFKAQFHPGQGWISDSEPDQGLGTVTAIEHRLVTGASDVRLYHQKPQLVPSPYCRNIRFDGG